MESMVEGVGHVLQCVRLMSKCGSGFRVGRVCLSVLEFGHFPCRHIWHSLLPSVCISHKSECLHMFRAYQMCLFHRSLLRKSSEWGSGVVVKY